MLRKIGTGWQFENEAILEDFLQRHLGSLLGLEILAQQHLINGQICDLVAISKTGQLVILELKNQEDRYIVQQLTRYFDAFWAEQPFGEVADYRQPIRLLAIAPTFHRDNFIDRKYSRLNIEFLTAQVMVPGGNAVLQLQHLDTGACSTVALPAVLTAPLPEIPSPPKSLLSKLAKGPLAERGGVLALRQQILGYDPRLQEIVSGDSILYGNGKTNLCAELKYDKSRSRMAIFLWLPHRTTGQKQSIVARLRVWTDWQTVSDLAHVPNALGRTITVDEWLEGKLQPFKKVVPQNALAQERYFQDAAWRSEFINGHRGNTAVAHHQSGIAMTFALYQKMIGQPDLAYELSVVMQLALDTWLSRT